MSGNPYRLYVSDVSYYSGKLEAYLRYKGIPHQRIEINADLLRKTILPATGYMKVPAMQTPHGDWLRDTTPMMQWLDRQHPERPIYPADPAKRFLALLLEDYADEWLWRPAMYYRWRFSDSHRLLRARLGRELSANTVQPQWLTGGYMRWRQFGLFVWGDGVRAHNESEIQALYARSLQQLSALLVGQRYLGGARPSIVDFAFFASMFRHFALDPYSAQIMVNTAPAVCAWVGRLWNAANDALADAEIPDFDFSAPVWDAVFAEVNRDYVVYLDANARAFADQKQRFDLALAEVVYPKMPVVRYRVATRQILLDEFAQLLPQARQQVLARLAGHDQLCRWLQSAAQIDSGLLAEFEMPIKKAYPKVRGWAGLKAYLGTPWDMPNPPPRPKP